METYWKQFEGWVTGLSHNPFESARLRLTGYYIIVVAIILMAFSLVLFYAQSKNIRDNFENDAINRAEETAITNTIDNLRFTIITIDGLVLLLTAALSYILAGKTLKPIKTALDAQAQFTADASHEFRTPLAIIKYNGDVAIKNPKLSIDEAKEVIQTSIEETDHLSTIVERLLMLARNENAWNHLSMTTVDLKQLMQKTIPKMEVIAKSKNISLKITDFESGIIKGNTTALAEMLLNILQNAIDYTNPGGMITVDLTNRQGNLNLIIQDTGIGIDEKDLPHIFKRFYKSDKARTMKQGGGLGLSIVQDIVERHHGRIDINSIPNKGTEVSVLFPKV